MLRQSHARRSKSMEEAHCSPLSICQRLEHRVNLKSVQYKTLAQDITPNLVNVLEKRQEVKQLSVTRLTEPRANGDGILGREQIGYLCVVNNDALADVASKSPQILLQHTSRLQAIEPILPHLDEVPHVVDAVLAEESIPHDAVNVQQVRHRVGVLVHVVTFTNNNDLQVHTLERLAVNITTS